MNQRIVQSKTPVLLVGGGSPRPEDLGKIKALAPTVIAADGGADFAMAAGLRPEAVIGDMDSISPARAADLGAEALIEYRDQNLIDFEKALRLIEAPLVIAAGFTEARLDHTLANFAILARRIGSPCVLWGETDIAFAAPERIALDLPTGTRLSLFPLQPMGGRSEGLLYPINGLVLDPLGRLGTSNAVTGPVTLAFDAPGTIILLPRAHLAPVMTALTG